MTVVVVDLKLNPSTSSTPPSSKASIVSKEEPKSTEEIPQQQQPDPPPSVNLAPLHISLPPHSAFGPSVHFSPTVVSSPSTPNPFAQASSTIEESTSAADPAPGPGPGPADPDMSPAAANTESHVDASPFGSVGLMLQEEEPMNPFISAFQQQGGQEQGSSLS